MRIAQVELPDASEYEKKCRRVDAAGLAGAGHEAFACEVAEAARSGAQLAHVYTGRVLSSRQAAGLRLPFVASAEVPRRRWPLRRPPEPRFVILPLPPPDGDPRLRHVPEAVEERYFAAPAGARPEGRRVGVFVRASVRNAIEQVQHRLHRTREDVEWLLLEAPPTPDDLAGVDLWIDPARGDDDLDGFVAEALVSRLPIVATRTAINVWRLEQGRSGVLVRPADPNEMTHAILAALFKPEVTAGRLEAARQTVARFRTRQRLRHLAQIYQLTTT